MKNDAVTVHLDDVEGATVDHVPIKTQARVREGRNPAGLNLAPSTQVLDEVVLQQLPSPARFATKLYEGLIHVLARQRRRGSTKCRQ